jgi:hypothetical protein
LISGVLPMLSMKPDRTFISLSLRPPRVPAPRADGSAKHLGRASAA